MLLTDADQTTILIRFIVGYVFLMEGIQKFVYSEQLGIGRFVKIGIPWPEFTAPLVGFTEILMGILFLSGLWVRFATIPALIIMLTALATTKLNVLMQEGLLTFSHQARNDLLMLFCCGFLLLKGAGAFSMDRKILDIGHG
jgi:putative oxidoreductase